MAKRWIAGAIKHPDALKTAAKAQDKTVSQLCAGKVSGITVRRCTLVKILGKMHKK